MSGEGLRPSTLGWSNAGWKQGALVGVVALGARLGVLAWAGSDFKPVTDGFYYDTIARRVADGLGYTWLWPDGAVTFAAHYPIGYPALLGLAYRVFWPSVVVAACLNAVIGAAAAVAAWRLAADAIDEGPAAGGPRAYAALVAGLGVGLHPGLVAYTPAVMTEGITAALVCIAAALVSCARAADTRAANTGAANTSVANTSVAKTRTAGWCVAAGVVLGLSTLVRPQALVLAPIFGGLAASAGAPWVLRLRRAALVTAVAIVCCLPWTARNCVRMKTCALVSVNGGWNLLIGAGEKATGTWSAVDVPPACREVWGEADKDACFGREAVKVIAHAPLRWALLAPAKLAGTFDYPGGAGYYLHTSRPDRFDDRARATLEAIEVVYERLGYAGALMAVALVLGRRWRLRAGLAAVGVLLLFLTHGYLSALLLVAVLALLGRDLVRLPVVYGATFGVVGATALTHAVFFGAGRYGMVVFPLVTTLSAVGFVAAVKARLKRGARSGYPKGDLANL